jgi:hypothetical protein
MGRKKKFVSQNLDCVNIKDIERKYVNNKLVLYQEDLEKIIGRTLDVPGAYFQHGGGGTYWNAYGSDQRIYYYYKGAIELLKQIQTTHIEYEKIDLYFEEEVKKQNNLVSNSVDKIAQDMFNKLDEMMKKQVVIYMGDLLNEKEQIKMKYKQISERSHNF